jgi:hypothetical protein
MMFRELNKILKNKKSKSGIANFVQKPRNVSHVTLKKV